MLDPTLLSLTAAITAAYQLLFFIVACSFKVDTVTDFAGGTNFVVLALTSFFVTHTFHTRQIIVTICVCAWGLRLSLFLFARILLWGTDNRFDDKRENVLKFLGFWVLQAVWVWTVSLPVTLLNSETSHNAKLNAFDFIGLAIFIFGLLLEAVSDQVKLSVKQKQRRIREQGAQCENDQDLVDRPWCHAGPWAWSRHPNYFGEIVLWWGVFIMCASSFVDWQWVALCGPLFITLLLLFLSGLPLLEESANKKYGSNPEFLAYRQQTSPLLPMPRRLYRRLPPFVKLCLLELPLYRSGLSSNAPPAEADNLWQEG